MSNRNMKIIFTDNPDEVELSFSFGNGYSDIIQQAIIKDFMELVYSHNQNSESNHVNRISIEHRKNGASRFKPYARSQKQTNFINALLHTINNYIIQHDNSDFSYSCSEEHEIDFGTVNNGVLDVNTYDLLDILTLYAPHIVEEGVGKKKSPVSAVYQRIRQELRDENGIDQTEGSISNNGISLYFRLYTDTSTTAKTQRYMIEQVV